MALVVAEGGYNGPTRLALGTWRYTRRQDDIRDLSLKILPGTITTSFQGTAQAAADTVAGRTQVTGTLIGSIAAFLPGTGSGKLRALAVSTADASPLVAGRNTTNSSRNVWMR